MDPAATPCDLKTDHLPHAYDTLRFESRFESGNLGKVVRITETYYELHLRPDFYTSKHCQWFYFQVGTKNVNSLPPFAKMREEDTTILIPFRQGSES